MSFRLLLEPLNVIMIERERLIEFCASPKISTLPRYIAMRSDLHFFAQAQKWKTEQVLKAMPFLQ